MIEKIRNMFTVDADIYSLKKYAIRTSNGPKEKFPPAFLVSDNHKKILVETDGNNILTTVEVSQLVDPNKQKKFTYNHHSYKIGKSL